jgi:hypothetical protein
VGDATITIVVGKKGAGEDFRWMIKIGDAANHYVYPYTSPPNEKTHILTDRQKEKPTDRQTDSS